MFKEFYLVFSFVGQHFLVNAVSSAPPYQVTISDPENVPAFSEEEPLSISVGPEGLSPEVVKKLGSSSNIIFSDLPDSPQFISLKDYENMMFATNELLEELLEQNDSDETNNNGDDIENSLNEQDRENYESVQKIYEETLDEKDHQDDEQQQTSETEKEPSTGETSTSETSTSETSTSEVILPTPSSSELPSSVPVSSVDYTPSSTLLLSSCSFHSSIHTSKTKKGQETSANITRTGKGSYNSSKNSTNTSKKFGMHSNTNHTNQTLAGFDNASTSVVPTTMFFALLISLLVLAQI